MKPSQWSQGAAYRVGAAVLGVGLLCAWPAAAQNNPVTGQTGSTVGGVAGQLPGVVGQAGQTAGQTVGQVGDVVTGTAGQVGNAAGNVVGGLQPTLQPVGQGVGNALNNLTQPDTVRSLLDFLSSVIPNHIEAHVNLDALRVDKVTLDIRGVDLRNLRVDLLVANSRGAGQIQSMTGSGAGGTSGGTSSGSRMGAGNGTGTNSNNGLWPSSPANLPPVGAPPVR